MRTIARAKCNTVYVSTTYNTEPIKGDVESVTRNDDGLIEVRLVGHAHRYQVRVATQQGSAPRLVELRMVSPDDAAEIDPMNVRQIPVRRLAAAAAKFEARGDGLITTIAEVNDPTLDLRPERSTGGRGNKLDDDHYRQVAGLLIAALEVGESPREYVGRELHASKPTVDKWTREAKRRGFLARDWYKADSSDNGGQ